MDYENLRLSSSRHISAARVLHACILSLTDFMSATRELPTLCFVYVSVFQVGSVCFGVCVFITYFFFVVVSLVFITPPKRQIVC